MKSYECDDGNTRDGDGCSSNCKIERFYECRGGNATNPDICINRKPPDFVSFKYFKNRTALVVFSTSMKANSKLLLQKLIAKLEKSLNFYIDGTTEEIKWTYSPLNSKSFRKILVKFDFNRSLSGNEFVQLKITNASAIRDLNDNMLLRNTNKVQVTKFNYISNSEKGSAEGSGLVSFYAMLPGVAISLVLSLALYSFSIIT
jgi:cysteine-rich repeat protein